MQSSVSYSTVYSSINRVDKPMTPTPIESGGEDRPRARMVYYKDADAWIPLDQNRAFPMIDGFHKGRVYNGMVEIPKIVIPDNHKMSQDVYHNKYCIFSNGKWIFSNPF